MWEQVVYSCMFARTFQTRLLKCCCLIAVSIFLPVSGVFGAVPPAQSTRIFLGPQKCLQACATTNPWSNDALYQEETIQQPSTGQTAKHC
mmetsp:Transcript_61350/g.101730  ORF Transcript_61350/g.101730 Transcript_61350/m.101730 type:complete len:90 (-) Transcript_61350:127-396(-)